MHLWNEYEGRIVAEKFPLIKLLEPEGRSAFFSTTNGSGTAAVLRLIEAHFDEPEILGRWDAVSKLDQQNLIRIKTFGQTTLDGTALVYAVMEPSDASLAGILKERALSAQETLQIATSLVPALQALHAKDLIHEHIEAANVLAVGEVVKLRSDCIREVPPDTDAREFKARDVRALAQLLLQSLTLQRSLTPATNLPAPFQQIVTNGISGAWGLDEIAAALGTTAAKPQPTPVSKPEPITATPPAATTTSAIPAPAIPTPEPLQQHRTIVPTTSNDSRRITPWTTIAAALILLLFIGWHFLHKSAPPIPTLATMPSTQSASAATTPAADAPTPAPAAIAAAPTADSASSARTQWRVVAYTYNHQDQAQHKVTEIAGKHAGLNPEVFAPKGHAPYLVTVGGPLNHDQAAALRRRARSEGLPRDTYIQNFPADAR